MKSNTVGQSNQNMDWIPITIGAGVGLISSYWLGSIFFDLTNSLVDSLVSERAKEEMDSRDSEELTSSLESLVHLKELPIKEFVIKLINDSSNPDKARNFAPWLVDQLFDDPSRLNRSDDFSGILDYLLTLNRTDYKYMLTKDFSYVLTWAIIWNKNSIKRANEKEKKQQNRN